MHALIRKLPRFRRAYREMENFAARERWSRSELDAYQLERLNRLWQRAIGHVPHYQQLRAALDLPPTFASLEHFQAAVPVLTKSDVRTLRRQLLARPARPGKWGRTGGSTGEPTEVYWETSAHLEALRGKYRWFASWDVDFFDRFVFLWGHFASFAPGWRGVREKWQMRVQDRLRNRIRLSAYDLNPADLRRHLQRIAAFQPTCIYAYASAAHLLAAEAERIGFTCPSLKAVVCTAERVPPATVEAVTRAFGVPAIEEYGSSECGFLAGSDAQGQLRIREDNVLLETVAREDGRYDIVVTPLGNGSFPLIRYAIGDVVAQPIERPARGLAILPPVEGRNNDLLRSSTGNVIYQGRIEAVFEFTDAIRLYQVRQLSDGSVRVLIERSQAQVKLDSDALRSEVQELVEDFPVTIEVVDRIPQSPAGKHRFIFSEMSMAELYAAPPAYS